MCGSLASKVSVHLAGPIVHNGKLHFKTQTLSSQSNWWGVWKICGELEKSVVNIGGVCLDTCHYGVDELLHLDLR